MVGCGRLEIFPNLLEVEGNQNLPEHNIADGMICPLKCCPHFATYHVFPMDPKTVWEGTANPPNYNKLYPSPTSKVRLDPCRVYCSLCITPIAAQGMGIHTNLSPDCQTPASEWGDWDKRCWHFTSIRQNQSTMGLGTAWSIISWHEMEVNMVDK